MPRYFEHVVEGSGQRTDRVGSDRPDDHAACRHARERVRDIVSRGRNGMEGEIVVVDDNGRLVISLTFSQAGA